MLLQDVGTWSRFKLVCWQLCPSPSIQEGVNELTVVLSMACLVPNVVEFT